MNGDVPAIGIIGGSGLYSMPGFEAQEEVAVETPWGSPSDKFVVGKLAGKDIAFLARHGRFSVAVAADTLAALGDSPHLHNRDCIPHIE